ncbi:glycosyltransferase family 4 protein [Thomasclavelia spiroformis]|uniref:glycosyltransferase family 4 protein n=1 Tax=Thomasclavelia spiroformis TaxID=29348 RepID=UPI002674F65E|nr:glycosyltransferase [Thomasclavelia spiroformis]
MRFLFTVASYYPVVGGVQKVTQNIAEELVRQGHSVTVLISKNEGLKELKTLNGVHLKYYELYTKKDKIVGCKDKYIEYLKKLCEEIDVLVNVCVHSALTDQALPHINEFNCKKVLYLHGIYDFKWTQKDKSTFTRILSKLYYNTRRKIYYSKLYKYARNYDFIVHLSEEDESMEYMKKHGIKNNIVIHNSAENSLFEPARTKCIDKYFLQVANYAEHKNQLYSLEAFYKSNCKDMKMIYIGSKENNYYYHLKKRNDYFSKKYGKRKVEFLVNLERNEIIEKFKHATAIILSSRVEKFPMVLVEGMACGVPFISTECGNVKNLPGGYIVGSINEMANKMNKICTNENNSTMLGKKGLAYAKQNFSLKHNALQLTDYLERKKNDTILH